MSYDPKCQALAEHFLPTDASPLALEALAQAIQDAIEDWIQGEHARLDAEVIEEQQQQGQPKP